MESMHPLQDILHRITDNVRSYSGRAMYGKECVGVTIETRHGLGSLMSDILDKVAGLDSEDPNHDETVAAIVAGVRSMRTDSMGTGTIVYFSNVPYFDDEASTDDEEDEEEDLGADSQNTKTLIAMGR